MENLKELWQKIIDYLKGKFPQDTVDLWLSPLELHHKNGTIFALEVPNKFFKKWLEENGEIMEEIKSFITKSFGFNASNEITIEYIELQNIPPIFTHTSSVLEPREDKNSITIKEAGNAATITIENNNSLPTPSILEGKFPNEEFNKNASEAVTIFNPKLNFSRFIVGKQNQFAYSGAWAVANDPGKQYNPLFIWGGVGLGKTHLLHAIGNKIKEKYPAMSVLYVQTKTFINDFIDSIRFSSPATFRNKYSNVGCLLIDDIQFLVGKPSCQEEFFYTFNAIYDSKKQIVLTSDKPPKDIEGLEERLISRFAWGLVVPIDPPDLETRIAILRSKAEEERVSVPEDVILYLANEIKNNIRILEGALTKVVANAALLGTPLTIDTAKNILKDVITKERETKPITVEKIQKVVAEHYNIKFSDMKSKKRTEALSLPRQIAMYLARTLTEEPYAVIGEDFGGKDHSTIVYAINKIKTKVQEDPFFNAEINKIIKKIEYD